MIDEIEIHGRESPSPEQQTMSLLDRRWAALPETGVATAEHSAVKNSSYLCGNGFFMI